MHEQPLHNELFANKNTLLTQYEVDQAFVLIEPCSIVCFVFNIYVVDTKNKYIYASNNCETP